MAPEVRIPQTLESGRTVTSPASIKTPPPQLGKHNPSTSLAVDTDSFFKSASECAYSSTMLGKFVLFVLCAISAIQLCSGSAIPMWEYLKKEEKVSQPET